MRNVTNDEHCDKQYSFKIQEIQSEILDVQVTRLSPLNHETLLHSGGLKAFPES